MRVSLDFVRFLLFFLRLTWRTGAFFSGKTRAWFHSRLHHPAGMARGAAVGEDTVPVVGPLRGRWGALQSRDPGEPPQRSPSRRLASLPRKRKCGRLFCCYGNKGQGAAEHRGPGPIKQGGVSSTPCPPGLGLAQAGEKLASENPQ